MGFFPLGDQGVLATFATEAEALRFAAGVRATDLHGIVDVVPAYTTVAVYHDPARVRYAELAARLAKLPASAVPKRAPGRSYIVPCCYDLGPDLPRIIEHTGLSRSEIIRLHTQCEYTVYAIGFCPGFPYLGYLPEPLSGVPRLPSPRVVVEPGSVGLTGRQTGIYPLPRPGGWNLLGRTSLELVNIADNYFPLRAGDRVKFEPIDTARFEQLRGRRLESNS